PHPSLLFSHLRPSFPTRTNHILLPSSLFTAPPPSAIYTLSLHDALPIFFFGRIKEIDNRSNYNNDKKQIPKNKVKEAIHFSVPPYFLSLSVDPWSFFVTFPIESLISVSALMFW